MDYEAFLENRVNQGADSGFDLLFEPSKLELKPFQSFLLEWAVKKGRSAIFADCGLGKTAMQMSWAQNVYQKTGKPVLILTPLAVSEQTIEEGEKFGIEVVRSNTGKVTGSITVTNYEKLHMFDYSDFSGVVCDESSILKNFDGARKDEITQFMRKVPYRLLATATAAPNDYIELGTSSEALGYMGFTDMLGYFFKNDQANITSRRMYGEAPKWRFKGHAELAFWRWVCSWGRACRKPSDLGFSDDGYNLPSLTENYHVITEHDVPDGLLFHMPANDLAEQREEAKRTITARCEKVLELINQRNEDYSIVWCHLNEEAKLLKTIIPNSCEISGSDSDEKKEKIFSDFRHGKFKTLITKPKIGALGLNFQHCNHVLYFPSHSYEQYYQAVRRCWRFGQKREVTVDVVLTEGQRKVMDNLKQKGSKAENMFSNLVSEMNNSNSVQITKTINKVEVPSWIM